MRTLTKVGTFSNSICTYLFITITVVRELLQEFAEGASIPDRFWGALPIHYAAHHDSYAANSEVIQLLIDAYPEGMCIPDGAGFLPLHRAGKDECYLWLE